MSHTIVRKYVATTQGLDEARAQPSTGRDKRFENQTLRNRDELMYIDVCQAMNTGDIGRVEASFLPWIYVFKATGKHKYASQMTKFLVNLQFNWPKKLSDIIRMNLLCNPSGHALAFRAVDWVVERNNLYTKVYRNCHVIIENGFHLQHQTIRHAQPDMTNTIRKLSMRIKEKYAHIKTFGRKALWSIPDQINEGMALMQEQRIVSEEETTIFDTDGDDFID
ncbi:hypothetical protein BD769DRAFT_1373278 [Suillus cothurnatus]|nr:hypothetical protein BD769DRAFT_1373278 [Suillus cothurnatus]